jgi:NADH-quinone oxidoreductase subunit N
VLAIATMFTGNLMALRQTNLMRLLAYSSVAHAGYMLTGFTVGSAAGLGNGMASVLFYLVVYAIMTIGAFAVLSGLSSFARPITTDAELRGLSRTRPVLAALLALFLFSLTGFPPTAGLLAKLFLFLAAWNDGSTIGYTLAIALAINAAISAGYYLRLVGLMYLSDPSESSVPTDAENGLQYPAWLASASCAALMIFLFFVPQGLWDAALTAIR